MLEENDDTDNESYNIIALPPENATDNITDEDSGAEDCPTVDHLPGSQLRAEATLNVPSLSLADNKETLSDVANSTRKAPRKRQKLTKNKLGKTKKPKLTYEWCKFELDVPTDEWLPIHAAKNELTPVEYFKLLFDEEIMKTMIMYTNQYAAKK